MEKARSLLIRTRLVLAHELRGRRRRLDLCDVGDEWLPPTLQRPAVVNRAQVGIGTELMTGMTDSEAWERLVAFRDLAEDVADMIRRMATTDPADAHDLADAYLKCGAPLVVAWWYSGPVERHGHGDDYAWMAAACAWDDARHLIYAALRRDI